MFVRMLEAAAAVAHENSVGVPARRPDTRHEIMAAFRAYQAIVDHCVRQTVSTSRAPGAFSAPRDGVPLAEGSRDGGYERRLVAARQYQAQDSR
jgi:hypothetical protein